MTEQPEIRPSWENLNIGEWWSPDEMTRRESAQSLLGLLCGWSGNQIREEEAKAHPDADNLAAMRAQNDEYWASKRRLPIMEDAEIRQLLEKYGPIARGLLGNA
ncbi:hypothetical protein [Dactylosporangium sp. NPDC005555]|uniref:hypothetical protein n=1 Tax=Dactylosporangium sp. NPDC005555 TaxID=3154889 RepID=UPI0033AC61D7